ncbi:hypothetical protein BT69DRAFT_1338912 [Atractiella rhizophila]|nr:hypothetical protein BT69DRAFT_1338912 [Atractiella rhizophila]
MPADAGSLEALREIVEDCTKVHREVQYVFESDGTGNSYFRFSAPLMAIGSQQWKEKEKVVGLVKSYVQTDGMSMAYAAGSVLTKESTKRAILALPSVPLPLRPLCYGRAAEKDATVDHVLAGRHVAIICGAGDGKSTVAKAILYDPRVQAKFREHFFIRCDNFYNFKDLEFHLTIHVFKGQQGDEVGLTDHFANRNCLLVLDNFETPAHRDERGRRNFFKLLLSKRSLTLSALVVVHHGRHPYVIPVDDLAFQTISIGRLDEHDAVKLFQHDYARMKDTEAPVVKEIVKELDYHALSTKLFALRAEKDDYKNLSQLLEEWRLTKTQLLQDAAINDSDSFTSNERNGCDDTDEKLKVTPKSSIVLSLSSPLIFNCVHALLFLVFISHCPDGLRFDHLKDLRVNKHDRQAARLLQDVGLVEDPCELLVATKRLRMLAPIREFINSFFSSPSFPLDLLSIPRTYFDTSDFINEKKGESGPKKTLFHFMLIPYCCPHDWSEERPGE